jgi:hypothetical protein
MLSALDKEVDDTRRTLDRLTTARAAYASAHGITGRKAVSSTNGEPANGSLASVVLRVMANGAWWHVDDVTTVVLAPRPPRDGSPRRLDRILAPYGKRVLLPMRAHNTQLTAPSQPPILEG